MMGTLLQLAKKHKNIVVLNTNSVMGVECEDFAKFFPDRYFSFGLAEANMVSAAAGFALVGKLPFVLGKGSVLFAKAFDQIRNDICAPNLNVKIIGFENGDGNDEDEKLAGVLQNMEVMCPSGYDETTEMLESMVLNYGPMYLKSV